MDELDPRFKAHNPRGWQMLLSTVLTMALYIALATGLRMGITALGYPTAGAFAGHGAMLLFGLYLVSCMWMASTNTKRKERGERQRMLGWGFWARSPGHKWETLSEVEADLQWTKMLRLPRGGRLLHARRCAVCPASVIHCEDADGNPCVLAGGLGEQLWSWWLAGLFFVHMPYVQPAEKPLRRLAFFQRVECRWRQLDAEESQSIWSALSDTPFREGYAAWRCADCGATRFDTEEAFGDRMMFFRGIPGYAVSITAIGFFGVWCEQPFAAAPRPQSTLDRAA